MLFCVLTLEPIKRLSATITRALTPTSPFGHKYSPRVLMISQPENVRNGEKWCVPEEEGVFSAFLISTDALLVFFPEAC
jgi:hypothetical protein